MKGFIVLVYTASAHIFLNSFNKRVEIKFTSCVWFYLKCYIGIISVPPMWKHLNKLSFFRSGKQYSSQAKGRQIIFTFIHLFSLLFFSPHLPVQVELSRPSSCRAENWNTGSAKQISMLGHQKSWEKLGLSKHHWYFERMRISHFSFLIEKYGHRC